jgi:hypothetical protein
MFLGKSTRDTEKSWEIFSNPKVKQPVMACGSTLLEVDRTCQVIYVEGTGV